MIRNYFIIAWRTLLANGLYTAINIFGLTVGITGCLVIFLIVHFELSFNRSIPGRDRIYRIYSTFSGDFDGMNRGICTGAQEMAAQFAGLEAAVPMHTYSGKVFVPGPDEGKEFEGEEFLVLAPSSYFTMLPIYTWIRGSAAVLDKPGQVVLTMDKARKYFGTDSPDAIMGKAITYNDSVFVVVAGLVEPPIDKTDFEFRDFISLPTLDATPYLRRRTSAHSWTDTNSSSQLFIKVLPETTDAARDEYLSRLNNERSKQKKPTETWDVKFVFQPLNEMHFSPEVGIFDQSRTAPSPRIMTALSIVAVVLLVLASINFINLETARAVKRAREVGIRKVMGSSRVQLVGHFLVQSILLTLFAVLLAVPASEVGLILFSSFIPSGVTLSITSTSTLLFLASVVFIVGVISGLYPAFVLSSFRPAVALKSQGYLSLSGARSGFMRKGLIVFQFACAQFLIIGTMVLLAQINFMLDKDLGFNRDAVVHINPPWSAPEEKRFVLKNELERVPGVELLSMCQSPPATNGYSSNVLSRKAESGEIRKSVMRKFGDPNFLAVYDIKLVAGRNLTPNHKTEILVNEAFLKAFELTPDNAIGTQVHQHERSFTIVGIVKDYHVFSLHVPYEPVYMCGWEEDLYGFSMKLAKPAHGNDFTSVISGMEEAWKKVYPDHKFEHTFVDETVRNFYLTERRMSQLSATAMAIAIIISCLGLFGLASYTSLQRAKEVGIRKVLGATARNILMLLSGDFVRLVAVAFLIAAPLAWYMSSKFLEEYTFKVTPGITLYIIAGAGSLLIAALTVSYQALKTSFMNPVDSLRME